MEVQLSKLISGRHEVEELKQHKCDKEINEIGKKEMQIKLILNKELGRKQRE